MKLSNLYNVAKDKIGSEEAQILCEEFLGFTRTQRIVNPNTEIADCEKFLDAIKRRENHEPIQYILGHWNFDGIELKVCEGVLIPRDDTATLTRECIKRIGNRELVGIDLCSGTGAIALSIAQACKNAKITALELYPLPFECLKTNVKTHGNPRVTVLNADVFTAYSQFSELDFIVSNPPYIETDEINDLQEEVKKEPVTALDGGTDGLDFYKVIVKHWTKCLKKGGFMAFEIGETQAESVSELLGSEEYINIKTIKDLNGLDRVVIAQK